MTRGRCGSLLLHRGGLAPPTLCRSPGALEDDPKRRFVSANYRIAKGLFDHLVGDGEQSGRYVEAQRLGSL